LYSALTGPVPDFSRIGMSEFVRKKALDVMQRSLDQTLKYEGDSYGRGQMVNKVDQKPMLMIESTTASVTPRRGTKASR